MLYQNDGERNKVSGYKQAGEVLYYCPWQLVSGSTCCPHTMNYQSFPLSHSLSEIIYVKWDYLVSFSEIFDPWFKMINSLLTHLNANGVSIFQVIWSPLQSILVFLLFPFGNLLILLENQISIKFNLKFSLDSATMKHLCSNIRSVSPGFSEKAQLTQLDIGSHSNFSGKYLAISIFSTGRE